MALRVRPLPRLPSAPRVPGVAKVERRFERAGLELRPLAGPDIPIPRDEDADFLRRFEQMRARLPVSLPEFICWEFLTRRKKLVPVKDFAFQAPMFGGRTIFGGFVMDFVIYRPRMMWMVQGERWHLLTPTDRARDIVAKAQLTGEGWVVLELWEDDLINRPVYVLDLAWSGREVTARRPI